MENPIIGYQGEIGSNTHAVAKRFAEELAEETGLKAEDITLKPLVSSKNVVEAIGEGTVDYGVMAFKNNLGGYVLETRDALQKKDCCSLYKIFKKQIYHYVFTADASVQNADVKTVCSHIQALSQCRKHIRKQFPYAELVEYADTAKAARDLKDGILDKNCAVICSDEAGEGLYKAYKDDFADGDSITEFRVYKKTPYSKEAEEQHTFAVSMKSWLLGVLIHPFLWMLFAVVTTLFAMLAFLCHPEYAVVALASALVLVILIREKNTIRENILISSLTGYWRFYSSAVGKEDVWQEHDKPRAVKITQEKGRLKLNGWLCGDQTKPLFESVKTVVFCEKNEKGSYDWTLVYWYGSKDDIAVEKALWGVVLMSWNTKTKYGRVNYIQDGKYWGMGTKELGTLTYRRITKDEFDLLKGELHDE